MAAREMQDAGLLEEMEMERDLDGFYSGTSAGTVNLQPSPMAFGNTLEEASPTGSVDGAGSEAGGVSSGVTAAAAAAAGTFAAAMMGGKLAEAPGFVGGAVGSLTQAAVPTSLQPVKEKAGAFLQKAQPWKDFILPLSIPPSSEACSRITANLYVFQTNYAILFVMQLIMSIVFQPSALYSLVATAITWYIFLRKNADPEWKPVVGGMELGPMQRFIALTLFTTVFLLFMAGGTIFNAALMYLFTAVIHGIVHDPSKNGLPGTPSKKEDAVPL
eukprot:TRINITY_DN55544_c0_g1_i1.p1 TRINITY_DN55544_c0_g1~~TRINITY_DN55544_c0_g1_i1.p1  ORF type:complete len:273 (-),score=51.42 TRINITY_DN55544_c0_g1_i1:136-954(-)